MFHRLRIKISSPYRILNGYGLTSIRHHRERKALYAFCKKAMEDKKYIKLNPDRREVYRNTMVLYRNEYLNKKLKFVQVRDTVAYPFKLTEIKWSTFDSYVDDHCGWYWN